MTGIEAWLLGYVETKLADRVLDAFRRDPFTKELDDAYEKWAVGLPQNLQLDPTYSPYLASVRDDELGQYPKLAELRNTLKHSIVPAQTVWLDALMESWRSVGSQAANPAAFFVLAENDARGHIQKLADSFYAVCAERPQLFRNTTLAALAEIQKHLIQERQPFSFPEAVAEWIPLLREIRPLYDNAMEGGAPWPGQHERLVEREYQIFLSMTARLRDTESTEKTVRTLLDMIRSENLQPAQFTEACEALTAAVAQLPIG